MSEKTATPAPARMAGARLPLIDGIEKVTGRARYTADLEHHDAYAGRIFRSPYSHAEIVAVDTAAARALPGVLAVLTGVDCDVPYGILPIARNEYPLARGKVRYRGEPVAVVVAEDPLTAERAAALIRMQVNELPDNVVNFDRRLRRQPILQQRGVRRADQAQREFPAVLGREADRPAGDIGFALEGRHAYNHFHLQTSVAGVAIAVGSHQPKRASRLATSCTADRSVIPTLAPAPFSIRYGLSASLAARAPTATLHMPARCAASMP